MRKLIVSILLLSVLAGVCSARYLAHRRGAFQASVESYDSYIDLDGANDYIDTPDSSGNSVTGDLELVAKVAPDDWTPTSHMVFVAKYNGNGTQKSFLFHLIHTSGKFRFFISDDGSNANYADSTTSPGFTDGDAAWVKCTYNTSTTELKYYTATTSDYPDPGDWSQLGSTVTSLSETSIYDGPAEVALGAWNTDAEADYDFNGKIYYAEVRDGIDGTIVAKFNASLGSDPTYDNIDGETDWTNTGGTPGP